MTTSAREPTLAEIERALAIAAYVVLRHGPAYAPTMERLKAERDALKRHGSAEDRARRILEELPADLIRLPAA